MNKRFMLAVMTCLALLAAVSGVTAVDLKPSALEQEFHQVRFEGVTAALKSSGDGFAASGDEGLSAPAPSDQSGQTFKRKSPAKAFLLSAVLPGAGQFYNGSKIKSGVFLGIEAATWILHFKANKNGDDKTVKFKNYNRENWSRATYEQYLLAAYRKNDDDSLIGEPGITHHLPDTTTQQYYEMTGKYDQFAWGWKDATRDNLGLLAYASTDSVLNNPDLLRINSSIPATVPKSDMRTTYEGMRKRANDYYSTADTWLIVTIANHLISGFEAYISAKKHNRNEAESDLEFSKVDVNVSLKSYHTFRDTPYVKMSYKF